MSEQEKITLLQDVKNYLRITWDEEDEDVSKMISRALAYFKRKTGHTIDFVKDEDARQLLLDRCRYVRNHMAEEFEDNFLSEILSLQVSVLPSPVEGNSDGS